MSAKLASKYSGVRSILMAVFIAGGLSGLLVPDTAIAVPVSSSLPLNPRSGAVTETLALSQGSTTNTLSGSITATDSSGSTATSTGNASWVNAGQGTVGITNS